jgi:DNA-binding SARP family transcriptional activator/class 3 adenylate cyclase
MSRLSLYLLGPPRIECDGRPIQVDTRKAVALVAYIAVTGERHLRDALVALLWPEYDQARGRTALRSTLYALRKALAAPSPGSGQVDWLDVDREDVGLHPDVDVWLDVEQFHSHLDECHTHGHPPSEVCPACLAPLAAAVALYRGDFLSGFTLKDSFNFDDWQFFQTEGLQRELAGALDRLVRCHIAQATFEPAIRYARRWLALDRLNESAHRQLMLLYAWSGQRLAALRQYQECVRVLESQLGVAPQAPTTALYQAIAEGRIPAPPASLAEERLPVTVPAPVLVDEAKHLVTALVADVGRSFTVASGIGPEEEASLVDRFLGVMRATVTRYGGQIERTFGGSVLAVFGAAQTHESDPELAMRAALEARQEVEALGLSMAAGVDTGEVYLKLAGPGREAGRILVGRVIDRAVRLAGQAQVGQILVGESTYRLTRQAFAFTPCPLDATGRDGPTRAYQVERLLLQARKTRGIEGLGAELIGRDEELARLKGALGQVLQGQGHVVFLIGEAGIGKSRLVAELSQATLAPAGEDGLVPLWLEGRCLELDTAAGYAPFVDVLRQYFAWGAREAERRRYERVTSSLQGLVEGGGLEQGRADEMAALLGRLLSLPTGDEWEERLGNENPQQLRWRKSLAVRDFIFALCKRQPVVLVFEDLHWADSLSVDLIALLMEGLPLAPLLLLCVYRREREHRCWHLATIAAQKCRGRYTELYLRELDHEQSRHMVESLLTKALPLAVRELILSQSQGNPFLIEEVVRSLIDAGSVYREGDVWRAREDVGLATMPDSVQGIILSRVDHLEEGWKHILQVAAAIGRVFRQRVLALALGQETGLERALWGLEERALIYQERTVPEVEYSFKHVLTQEAVYQNIPQRQRRSIHQQVAEAIVTLYREDLDEYYEQLAHHYDQSGDTEQAVEYLFRAGEKARRRCANAEAITLLSRGLELLRSLPESPERARRELGLLVALGVPPVLAKGHAAPEVERAYARARALSGRSATPGRASPYE